MIYFTAGLFFGDNNVLNLRHRPFLSVEHMDTQLVNNWNRIIKENDTIYILGDMFSSTKCFPQKYLSILKGKKYLIYANADKKWMKKIDVNKFFIEYKSWDYITYGKRRLNICHNYIPCVHCWADEYLIYADGNEYTRSNYWFVRALSDNILDASVDVNDYRPVTFEEMLINNKKHKETSILCKQYLEGII